jgi:UDP-N-acetylglucosamine 1-carboxyvinyltransferase
MDTKSQFIIQGLAGARTLEGSVRINGAKNSALKAMAAAILFDGPVTLENG